MTGWLEAKANKRCVLRGQTEKIKANTLATWKALWEAIGEVCAEYQQRFPADLEPYDHIARSVFSHDTVGVKIMHGPATLGIPKDAKRELRLVLDQQNCKITWDHNEFRIAIGRNGDVCLMDTSGELTLDQAVEKIMTPFLFPDLEEEEAHQATA